MCQVLVHLELVMFLFLRTLRAQGPGQRRPNVVTRETEAQKGRVDTPATVSHGSPPVSP